MSSLAIPQVAISNDSLTTTTKNIAAVFSKRHGDVLRDVRDLEVPTDFRERNFALSKYEAGNRSYKMYNITQDGFTLLVMGYIGKKAMQFKLAYIEAFNKMHKELLNTYKQAALPETITPKQKLAIRDAIAKKVYDKYSEGERRAAFKTEYHDFYEAFDISKYEELPASRFGDAMGYILGEWVPDVEVQAIADDKVVVSRGNIKALVKLANLAADRYGQIQDVEEKMKRAEAAAEDAREAMRKFRYNTWDAVRDTKLIASTFKNDIR